MSNRLAKKWDVLLGVRAPVGRINVADTKIIIGRGLSAIRRKDKAQVFLFHQLKETFKDEDCIGGGTVFKAVTKDDLVMLKLIAPPREIVISFETIVAPMRRYPKFDKLACFYEF